MHGKIFYSHISETDHWCARRRDSSQFHFVVIIFPSEFHGKLFNPHMSETVRPTAKFRTDHQCAPGQDSSHQVWSQPEVIFISDWTWYILHVNGAAVVYCLLYVFRLCEATTVNARQNPPWRHQSGSGFSGAAPRVSDVVFRWMLSVWGWPSRFWLLDRTGKHFRSSHIYIYMMTRWKTLERG